MNKIKNLAAHVLIQELIRLGVDYFCIAPGSRSTPLVYEVALEKEIRDFIHYDERGLAFHALGYAKATNKPAVIIITSGTSLANVFPAVVEAYYSQIPLIVISADRPYELIDCGSNQAIDQSKFFQSYVQWHTDIPLCDEKLPLHALCSTIDYAYAKSKCGPVHINCRLREPFLEDQELLNVTEYDEWKEKKLPHSTFITSTKNNLVDFEFDCPEKGVIILGNQALQNDIEPIINLAKRLKYPIFADILSPQTESLNQTVIKNYDALLKAKPNLYFDCILQFGHTFLSKTLLQRLKKSPPKSYLLISNSLRRSDPNHIPSQTIVCSTQAFCQSIQKENPSTEWLSLWQQSDKKIINYLNHFFRSHENNDLTEPSTARILFENARDDELYYIASSMPIRDALAFKSHAHPLRIFCNRGCSGIDGNLATAFGISQALDKTITILIGDGAALYDLNSLAMVAALDQPPTIVIINNAGCGIFSFLPIAEKKDIFDRYFHARHSFNFAGAAAQFGLDYHSPKTNQEFSSILTANKRRPKLIEIFTEAADNFKLHKKIDLDIQHALAQNLG